MACHHCWQHLSFEKYRTFSNGGTMVEISARKVSAAAILVSKVDLRFTARAIENVKERQNEDVHGASRAVRSQTLSQKIILIV
jgi:hypothetical protein